MKGIVITPDDEVRVQDFGEPLHKTVGALWDDWIEIVHPRYLEKPYVLIVDEERRLKDTPINLVGSIWNGVFEHGEHIKGTVVVMKDGPGGLCEPDIVGLSDWDIEWLTALINEQFDRLDWLGLEKKAAHGKAP